MRKIFFFGLSGMVILFLVYFTTGKTFQSSQIQTGAVRRIQDSNPAVVKLNQAGLRYFESKQFEMARDQFKSALELSPNDPTLLNNLAFSQMEIGKIQGQKLQLKEAIASFESAIQINPNISTFHVGAGWAYDKAEQEEKALQELEEAIRLNPKEILAYQLLGDIYYKNDNPDKAIEALEKALALQPDEKSLQQRLAKIKQDRNTESKFEKSASFHFTIKFEGEENKEIAQKVSEILEAAYRDIGSIFYQKSFRPVIVILYSDKLFRETVHSPSWAGGIYDGKIRIPVQGSAKDPEGLRRILYHEYTHAVLFQLTPSPIPTWLNEGLAMYFEGNHSMNNALQIVDSARREGRLIPLRRLQGTFMDMDANTSELAYQESRIAVQNLIDHYSIKRIRDVLERYRGLDQFASVFEEGFLISYDDYEKSFMAGK
ncbi:MAG: tetratricopeptide repeat protein [Nitrospirae bacterium]|nr:tetratricopeptide repeat protein [Nitrospirota bacterium]MBI3352586.1 tetratricopeptide repeat protein [Nitrospirota bacterium]